MEVGIVEFPETKIAVVEHRGPPDTKHESIARLIAWRIENGFPPSRHPTYGIHYNGPRNTPPEAYRLDIGIAVPAEVAPNGYGVMNRRIPGGRCAVVRHLGAREKVAAVDFLHEVWLPGSGEKRRDFPLFFHYVNVGPGVTEAEVITDIYLPIL